MMFLAFLDDPTWMPTLLVIANALAQIIIVARVIMRRLDVGVSLAWVFVVAGFPLAGPLIYMIFGELRLGSRRAQRFRDLYQPIEDWLDDLGHARCELPTHSSGKPFSELAEKTLGMPAVQGGKLRLMSDWQQSFDAIIADIHAAQETCCLEFYIWSRGGRADEVAEALVQAAARGVKCRVLLDDMGSRAFLKSHDAKRLRKAGVELVSALPGGLFRLLFVRFDLRLHRKVVVIDGRIAYTGSMNLVDPRFFKQNSGVGQWVDAMTRIEGPPVEALAITFLGDWYVESGQPLAKLKINGGVQKLAPVGDTIVQVVPSGPAYGQNAIERALVTAVFSAREEIILTTPYFVPDEPLQMALVSAAMRGVRVTLITPKSVDSRLVRYATGAFYSELIEAGVRIMLFDGGLLHTKSVTVDGEWSLFGSLNLDPRSLHLNFELTLGIYDDGFTQELRALQLKYLETSERLTAEQLAGRSTMRLASENLARLVAPLL